MASSSPVPLGEIFAGKYRVDRVLGEGGMGVVVAAHHLELDQPVAIKFLLDELAGNAEGAERFRREARAAAKIQSDNVVRVLDVGVAEGIGRYMVMEFLDGRDLAEELQAVGRLEVGTAAAYLLEALDAVGHAHAVGIVHRDLKPANLFLARRPDGSFRVKVLDFGISKTFGAASQAELSLTKTSAWIGSPLYMSPEQMQSARDVDHRTDIWSLGAIFYELLTGRPPYVAESLPQLCNLLLTTDPQPIGEVRPDVPPALADIVTRCLVRSRDERVQSVAEIAEVLAPFAGPFSGARTGRVSLPSLLDRTELGPAPSQKPTRASSLPQVTPALGGAGVPAETVSGHTATLPGVPGGEKKKLGWILAVAALALGGVGVALGLRGQGSEEPLAPRVDVGETPAAAPEGTRPDEASPSKEPAAPSEVTAAASPSPSADETEPSAVPAPSPGATGSASAPQKVPASSGAATKTTPPKKTEPAPSNPGKPPVADDLSEFGGRR